jgi:lysophospholipase L1-like esterase
MPSASRDLRICFFGDSFTNGTLDATYLSWTARVCANLPFQVTHYNLGIRGDTALDIEARWEAESRRRWKPTAERRLVFSFGTNDCVLEDGRPRMSLADSVASAERILARATECCPTLFIGPPAVELEDRSASFARLSQLSQAYAALAGRIRVPYVDLFACTQASEAWADAVERGDGTHPELSGYALLAEFIGESEAWRAWW